MIKKKLKEKMMKKLFFGLLAVGMISSSLFASGVSSINNYGTSASGKTVYKVKCYNGSVYKIYRSNGEWYSTSLGSLGGNYRSLQQEAQTICK